MSYGGPLGPPPPPGAGGPPGYGAPPGYGPPPGAGAGGPPGYGPPPGGYGAVNPYQAPAAMMGPTVGLVDPPGTGLKWLFIGGHLGYWLFAVGGMVISAALATPGEPPSGPALIGSFLPLFGALFLLMALVAAAVWLHKAWSSVPEQMRYTDGGRWITPGQAVGYNFIPLYGWFYWVFVSNLGLCDAINRTLAARGAPPRAPKGLAIAACICHLVPYCNLLVGPILWTVYLFMMDTARREMLARTA
jgi:hypothetical protein